MEKAPSGKKVGKTILKTVLWITGIWAAILIVVQIILSPSFLTKVLNEFSDDYIDGVFETLDAIACDHYYYRMGAAWCVATAMAKQREKTIAYLLNCRLDDWTYHKALRKMLESYRISDADKAVLRTLKMDQRLGDGMLQ